MSASDTTEIETFKPSTLSLQPPLAESLSRTERPHPSTNTIATPLRKRATAKLTPRHLHKGSRQPASYIFRLAHSHIPLQTLQERRQAERRDTSSTSRAGSWRAQDNRVVRLETDPPRSHHNTCSLSFSLSLVSPGCLLPTMPPTPHQHQHQHHADENASPPLLRRRADLMVPPAAASEAAASSADRKPRAKNTDKDMPAAGGDRKVEPLIVFDWDDTILTSSWIQVNELLQAGSYDDLPLDVKRDLAQLEQRCVRVSCVCLPQAVCVSLFFPGKGGACQKI